MEIWRFGINDYGDMKHACFTRQNFHYLFRQAALGIIGYDNAVDAALFDLFHNLNKPIFYSRGYPDRFLSIDPDNLLPVGNNSCLYQGFILRGFYHEVVHRFQFE